VSTPGTHPRSAREDAWHMNTLRPLLALAVLLSLCACESRQRTAVKELKGYLRTSLGNRKQKISEIAKEAGVQPLKEIALDPDESMRLRVAAIEALGTLRGEKEATKVLIQLANGQDAEMAYSAIIALGVQRAPESAEELKKFIKHPNPHLRAAACFGIYEYGDKALHPLVEEAANDQNDEVTRAANLVLDWIVNGPPAAAAQESPSQGTVAD